MNLTVEAEEINEVTRQQYELQSSWEKVCTTVLSRLEILEAKDETKSNLSYGSWISSSSSVIKLLGLILLRTNSSAKSFYENIYSFKKRFRARGYPHQKNPLRLNLLNGIRLYKRTTKCERKFYLSLPRTTLLCQTIKTS